MGLPRSLCVCVCVNPRGVTSAMAHSKRLIVVTDLDSSLLDDSYSWAAAMPALERLQQLKVPLILNSSKTMSEMAELANALGTMAPVVAENGGLVAVHQDAGLMDREGIFTRMSEYLIEINGLSRAFILEQAHVMRDQCGYQFEGFSDWSDIEIAERTGLCRGMAHRAQERYATEPILWHDTAERREDFEEKLARYGIRMLRGGRFLHLMGEVDKADGSRAAIELIHKSNPQEQWYVVAIGDSANDLAMLEAADTAIVIPHADGPRLQPNAPHVVHAHATSTVGWNDALLRILNETK